MKYETSFSDVIKMVLVNDDNESKLYCRLTVTLYPPINFGE